MANYRFYVLDEDDHVREPPKVFECPVMRRRSKGLSNYSTGR